jgi:hypothetical protein
MTDIEKRLAWRNIPVASACPKCTGAGVFYYPSTPTWRGSSGAASMTYGVCDVCWGSGDRYKPWTNLKTILMALK